MKFIGKIIIAIFGIMFFMACEEDVDRPYGELYLLTDTVKVGQSALFGYSGTGFYYTLETGELTKRYTEERRDSAMVMESLAAPYHNVDLDTSFIGYAYNTPFAGDDTTYQARLIVTNAGGDGNILERFTTAPVTVVVVK
ncbi:MAG: hypothetical protein HC819_13335 [Cyclobacteriaceae bacterium]|nr:hypothetical protein [Cyclobacteriaceae bacterium]